MSDSSHPLHFSLVRIRDAQGAIVGAGFLAAPQLVCTCAHVVADALHISRETEQPPEQEVRLDFPLLEGAEGTAYIHLWVHMEPGDGGGDIAILRLTTAPPAAARPARLLPVSTLSGKAFAAYGFPSETDIGQNAYGILRDRLANGYVQLEGITTQGYRVQQGYSGTPVWDQRGRGVVGMVVAADRAPDAKVAFLIPNDLILRDCPEIKLVTFHQLFAPLTDGLTRLPGSPLGGVEQFLREYLGTPEIPAPFGGRQVQLAALDRWLATPAQPYALLVAEAGRGKSALLARWVAAVADERRADVVFVPISIRFSTSLKSTSMSLLGARLRHLHGAKADLPRDAEGWLAEIEIYLREDRPVGPPLLIVLDGADEAADWMMGQDLRFPPEPGSGIKVLVSARLLADCDAAGWLRRLEWQGRGAPIELPLLDRAGMTEVLRSMGDPLARLVTQVDAVGELHRLSEGDPLLVRLYVEALRGTGDRVAFLTPEELGQLKPGLQTYFDQWWDDQRRQWGMAVPLKEPAVRALLNLLACALGPLSTDDLLALMEPEHFDLWILEEALRPLARFVVGDGKEQGYVFSHPRLNQYFYEKLPPRERQAWEQRFMSYGRHTLLALTSGEREANKVSSYPIRYYGAHLERGDAHSDRFDEMVSEGWLRAWEMLEGAYDGFLNDLARAWRRAEEDGARAQSTQERSRAIGWQCRYALIVASIKSLAGNIPPALLAALVDRGVWIPIQGVAYARQIQDEGQRAWALAGLAPYLPAPLQETVLYEALGATRAIADEDRRAWALAGLAPYLPESLLPEALVVARAMAREDSRAEALVGLAPHLPESLQVTVLPEALTAARVVVDGYSRARAMRGLAPYLPAPLLREALAIARAMAREDNRAEALAGLVPRLGELGYGDEALATMQAIADEDRRARALAGLAPYLPAPLLPEALVVAQAMARRDRRAGALARLAPHLPAPLLREALTTVQAIADEDRRAGALVGLAPYLPAPVLSEVFAIARAIADEGNRAKALAGLAPHLPAPLLPEALAIARAMASEDGRARALVALAPHLPAPLLREALATAQAMADHRRVEALVGLVPRLGELDYGDEALAIARAMADEDRRAQALAGLAPHVKQLPVVRLYFLWNETLHILAIRTRSNLLSDIQALVPIIATLGGKEALVATMQAIIEVGKWFP